MINENVQEDVEFTSRQQVVLRSNSRSQSSGRNDSRSRSPSLSVWRDRSPSPCPARKRGKLASPACGGRFLDPMLLKRDIEELVTNCLDYKSEVVLSNADGLKDASSRNLVKQRSIIEEAGHFHALLQDMPSANCRPLAAWTQP